MTSSTALNTVPHPQTHTPHPQTATDIQPAVNLTHLTKSFGDLRAVDGLDLSIRPGKVSSVLQTGGLPDDLTVRETVDYTSAIFASSLDTDVVLERAGIADIAGSVVKKCSGGQKQRLRFAMALLPDPALTGARTPRSTSRCPWPHTGR
ncbi:ATP-binding cassette domain-containing protein [Brevibacterium permense]|nr:ATP-binding cassette domain-containing protein [Brevibacterium permense]